MNHHPHLAGTRVLLAEDNAITQRVAVQILRHLGCQIDVCSNGAEALGMLTRCTYDIVFMDCQMPVLDGYEATREFRQRELRSAAQRRTPVVAMTVHTVPGDHERCLTAGMDEYLAKPITLDAFAALLSKYRPAPSTSFAALRELVGGDLSAMRSILDTFRIDSSQRVTQIEAAMSSGDLARARLHAHALKGSSKQIGVTGLAKLAAQLEQHLVAGDPAAAQPLLAPLLREFAEVHAQLLRELGRS